MEHEAEIDVELVNELDEDELFELIAQQQVRNKQRRSSAHVDLPQIRSSSSNNNDDFSTNSNYEDVEGSGNQIIANPIPVIANSDRVSTIVEGEEAIGTPVRHSLHMTYE